MNRSLSKELRPLLLPWCVAAAGGVVPPDDDVTSVLGACLNFGGFAVLAAMVFAIDFQERTLPLLLSQPAERSRLWLDKLSAIGLAAVSLALFNWRAHLVLSESFGSLFSGIFFLATICSAGLWIQITHSVFSGVGLALLTQVVVFTGVGEIAGRALGPSFPRQGLEIVQVLTVAALIYCGCFLWLSREFWRKRFVMKTGVALLLLAAFHVGQLLVTQDGNRHTGPTDFWLAALFVIATCCSVGWWTMVARTTIGGAVLTVASQFLCLLAVRVVLSQFTGADGWFDDARFLGIIVLGTPLYSLLFLRAGWHKFAGLEVKDARDGEVPMGTEVPLIGSLWASWLRCRAGEGLLNLVRKELRLQKPLLLLAGVFCLCWIAVFGLHWIQPHRGYANLSDVLVCLYAPISLALAGCISLGEEKNLGLSGWNLALPVSAARQWTVKLVVAGFTGVILGLVLPLCLAWISARTTDTSLLLKENENGWLALAGISCSLFILSFWTATLLPNTIQAALTATVALVPLFICGMVGSWCAQQSCGFPQTLWVVIGTDGRPEVPGLFGILGFVLLVAGIALVQSLMQFRRIRIPGATVVVHTLVLALGVVAGSFWWMAVLMSAGK